MNCDTFWNHWQFSWVLQSDLLKPRKEASGNGFGRSCRKIRTDWRYVASHYVMCWKQYVWVWNFLNLSAWRKKMCRIQNVQQRSRDRSLRNYLSLSFNLMLFHDCIKKIEMNGIYRIHIWAINVYTILIIWSWRRRHLKEQDTDWKIILKWILAVKIMGIWIGLICVELFIDVFFVTTVMNFQVS